MDQPALRHSIAIGIVAFGLLIACSTNVLWGALLGIGVMAIGFVLYRWG